MLKAILAAGAVLALAACNSFVVTTEGASAYAISAPLVVHSPNPSFINDESSLHAAMVQKTKEVCPQGYVTDKDEIVVTKTPEGWDQDNQVWHVRCKA